ncbi:uncharacterized protein M6B38_168570 [Iris pallida]|uniref:Transcriptional coactivator Hfi1/Transcriptional adapter 1 n=1 Tax=Iris pallida TaxID=29817 RepID=A0AAX6EVS5_IRIPA|nr:uncharacterized protein M6B38_168570 [Iris pallida]
MGARINIGDLKYQIVKRVGPDRAQQYFGYLNRLLSQKLSKPEFNKLCVLTLGRENLHLHNQLVLSVLRNACQAKTPPPPLRGGTKWSPPVNYGPKVASQSPVLSNGNALPQSPRRSRSGVSGQRIKDRPSPLGPNGRAEVGISENGDLGSCDLKRPLQHLEGALAEQSAKRQRRTEKEPMVSVEAVDVDRVREDSKRRNDKSSAKIPIQAPLGIPFFPPSIGGSRRNLAQANSFSNFGSCSESGDLWHSEDLRRRMERIEEGQGLGGVALDCANLLNNGLNAYLKRLIKSCVELVGTRSGHGQMKQQAYKHQAYGKPVNGLWQGNHVHLQSGRPPFDGHTDPMNRRSITMQDFRVAMELNPQQLGEDWPLLLEKICHHSFEE